MLTPFYDHQSGNYGYQNQQQEIIIEPVYDEAEPFEYGVGVVRRADKYGLIDESGKIIIPTEFDSLFTYKDNWVKATKNKIDYLYTIHGEQLLQLPAVKSWYTPEHGIIRAKKDTGWGALDMAGDTVIPFEYPSLGPVEHGRLSFYQNKKWGWLDVHGNVIIPAMYSEVGIWSDKYWWSRDENGYTLYDYDNIKFIDEGWTKILEPFNGIAAAKAANGWKYIDANFKTILQLAPVYEWVEHFHDGMAAVKRNGSWGFIDSNANEIITPAYQRVGVFRENICPVEVDDHWGYINKQGEMIIAPQFIAAGSFKNGKAWVRGNWQEWYIDAQGNDASERKYWD